jgi:hypothetical protein
MMNFFLVHARLSIVATALERMQTCAETRRRRWRIS